MNSHNVRFLVVNAPYQAMCLFLSVCLSVRACVRACVNYKD